MADSVICSTSSNSSSDWDSHDSLRFLGSQITWKVPGNWVTESLMLCWDIKHKRKSFHKVSKMQMVALCQEVHPMLSPPSRSCSPWILLVECLMQTVTKTPPRVFFFWTGTSPGPRGQAQVHLVPACPAQFWCPAEQWCYQQHKLWVTVPSPLPLWFLGRNTYVPLGQKGTWKTRYYFTLVLVALVNSRCLLSDIDSGEFFHCFGLRPVCELTQMQAS